MVTVPRVTFVRTVDILGQNIFYLLHRVRLLRAGSDAQFKVANATAHGACQRKTRRNSNSITNMDNEMVPRLQVSGSLSVKPNRTVMWGGHALCAHSDLSICLGTLLLIFSFSTLTRGHDDAVNSLHTLSTSSTFFQFQSLE